LAPYVAAEFEKAVEGYPAQIIIDNKQSVDKFLAYLARSYGVAASRAMPKEVAMPTLLLKSIEKIRAGAMDERAVEAVIRSESSLCCLKCPVKKQGRHC